MPHSHCLVSLLSNLLSKTEPALLPIECAHVTCLGDLISDMQQPYYTHPIHIDRIKLIINRILYYSLSAAVKGNWPMASMQRW
jgi:hypothetical protein